MIARWLGFAALALSTCPGAAQQPISKADAAYVVHAEPLIAITNVTIIDETGAPPQRDMTVLMDRGRIASVTKASEAEVPAGAAAIDGTGKTLLPGFVMMHEHLFYPTADSYDTYPDIFSRLYLAGGATTIRTAGSMDLCADLATARTIANGAQVGPDIDVVPLLRPKIGVSRPARSCAASAVSLGRR